MILSSLPISLPIFLKPAPVKALLMLSVIPLGLGNITWCFR
jgi:hypothetical protein